MSQGGMIFDFSDNNPYQQIFDYQGGPQPIYVGWSTPGVSQSSPQWKIRLYTYSIVTVSGSPISVLTQVQFAKGDPAFRYAWSLRSTYAYA